MHPRSAGPHPAQAARARAPRWATVSLAFAVFFVAFGAAAPAYAERLKELTTLMGARSNQLMGYGLVVGLEGTGDSYYAGIGMQSVATMLRHLGVNSDPNFLRLRNIASVMVIAEQPAFAAPGQRIDVTVSSMGDARTLEGGTLIASPLKGSDLRVYAIAQGPLSVGGYSASGLTRSRLQKNFTTVGRIPNGAIVERDIAIDLPQDRMSISLRSPDFTTAVRIGEAIDARLQALGARAGGAAGGDPPAPGAAPEPWAVARDSGTVLVRVPPAFLGRIPKLMSELEALEVSPDWVTRVVINERTGTVVLSEATRLAPVAIAHGGLTLEVKEQPVVSQPNAAGLFGNAVGQTRVVQRTTISAQETYAPLRDLAPGASLSEVVKALNTLGVGPRDLVAILQALKASGALRAELVIN